MRGQVLERQGFDDGELQLRRSTWDEHEVSVKYAYPDSRGRTSRGAPEIPVRLLLPMLRFVIGQGALPDQDVEQLRAMVEELER